MEFNHPNSPLELAILRLERRTGIAAAEDYLYKMERRQLRRWKIAVTITFMAGIAAAAFLG